MVQGGCEFLVSEEPLHPCNPIVCTIIQISRMPNAPPYRGTSPIRKRPLPENTPRILGIGLR